VIRGERPKARRSAEFGFFLMFDFGFV
jgi:hypothetical protein